MKFFVKVIITLVVVGVGYLFYLKKPDGKPWLDYKQIVGDPTQMVQEAKQQLGHLKRKVGEVSDSVEAFGSDKPSAPVQGDGSLSVRERYPDAKFFRYRDAAGSWQYVDRAHAPEDAEPVSLKQTNSMQAVEVSQNNEVPQDASADVKLPSPMTISPEEVSKLIEDAKGVQGLMDQRQEQLNQY